MKNNSESPKKFPAKLEIPLCYDKAFKCIFLKNEKFLKRLLIDYLHLDFEITDFEIKNSEQFIDNIHERKKVLDVYVVINKTKHISLELNNCDYNAVKQRNIMYANKIYNTFFKSGESSVNIEKQYLYQLNLNVRPKSNEPGIRNIRICDINTREIIADNYEIIARSIEKGTKPGYNDDKEKAWDNIITTESYYDIEESLKKIFSEEDSEEFIKEVLDMESDKEIINFWNDEKLNEAIEKEEKRLAKNEGIKLGEERGEKRGIKLGEDKKEQSLIENMFKNKLDINLISKITGTSVKKLQKIKTNLFL